MRKKWGMRLIFYMQISIKACYKLIPWFWWGQLSIPQVPKIASLQCLYNVFADKHQSFLQVDLGIKVSYKVMSLLMDMITHSQGNQSNYLYNIFTISQKNEWMKIMNDVIFYIEINIKFSTTWHYCFWRKRSDMSTVPRMGTSNFYNILRTNMTLAFVFIVI